MPELDTKEWIALGAAVIATVAALASGYIALLGQWRQFFTELRKWADQACDTLSEAVHACDLDPARMGQNEFFMIRHELRQALSSLLDRGRWFFPNLHHEEINTEVEEAYRGLRQPALSALAQAYLLVGRMSHATQGPNVTLRAAIVAEKRRFVTEVQNYLDPRNRRTMFARLTSFGGSATGRRSRVERPGVTAASKGAKG